MKDKHQCLLEFVLTFVGSGFDSIVTARVYLHVVFNGGGLAFKTNEFVKGIFQISKFDLVPRGPWGTHVVLHDV